MRLARFTCYSTVLHLVDIIILKLNSTPILDIRDDAQRTLYNNLSGFSDLNTKGNYGWSNGN